MVFLNKSHGYAASVERRIQNNNDRGVFDHLDFQLMTYSTLSNATLAHHWYPFRSLLSAVYIWDHIIRWNWRPIEPCLLRDAVSNRDHLQDHLSDGHSLTWLTSQAQGRSTIHNGGNTWPL